MSSKTCFAAQVRRCRIMLSWWRSLCWPAIGGPGGGSLDLFADRGRSIDAIRAFSDARSALEFERFAKESETLFKAFQRPIIEAAEPSYSAMIRHVAMRPGLRQ